MNLFAIDCTSRLPGFMVKFLRVVHDKEKIDIYYQDFYVGTVPPENGFISCLYGSDEDIDWTIKNKKRTLNLIRITGRVIVDKNEEIVTVDPLLAEGYKDI